MMLVTMMKLGLLLLNPVVAFVAVSPSAGNCVGRCGERFNRGQPCACDSGCAQHKDCCPDFESTCSSLRSCQGRCNEVFRRGRPCDCDLQCGLFNSCCLDHPMVCGASVKHAPYKPPQVPAAAPKVLKNRKVDDSEEDSDSDSDESDSSAQRSCPKCNGVKRQTSHGLPKPQTQGLSGHAPNAAAINYIPQGGGNIPAGPLSPSSAHNPYAPNPLPHNPSAHNSLPHHPYAQNPLPHHPSVHNPLPHHPPAQNPPPQYPSAPHLPPHYQPAQHLPPHNPSVQNPPPQHPPPNHPPPQHPPEHPSPPHQSPPDFPALSPSLVGLNAPALDGGKPHSPPSPGGGMNIQLLLLPGGMSPSGSSQGVSEPSGPNPNPNGLREILESMGLSMGQGVPEASGTGLPAEVNLCSSLPMDGLTVLGNGTILIFKDDVLWFVDPDQPSVGSSQSITNTLGIPPPIDTVFTRTGCNRDTYIIKDDQLWQFDENMEMQPGYPKPLQSEFQDLSGNIDAALAVPASKTTAESVFFFKSGDIMQKFSFPPCGGPPEEEPGNSLKGNFADVHVSKEIHIKVSLEDFPTPITSAMSMPPSEGNEIFRHFVFSGPLFFRVHISDDLLVLDKPDPLDAPPPFHLNPAATAGRNPNSRHPANSINYCLGCE